MHFITYAIVNLEEILCSLIKKLLVDSDLIEVQLKCLCYFYKHSLDLHV